MPSPKPTIVIVPGSFSVYGAYDSFVARLRAQGHTTLALQLPSTQKRYPLPPATLQDDAAHVRGVVERLIAESDGTEVVILAHSYGGTVATEALEGLGVQDGKKGGVKRMLFLSAMAPKVGETQITALKLAEGFFSDAVDGYLHNDPVVMAPIVCNDLPYAEAYECALQVPHQAAVSFQSAVTKTSWMDIPVTYIFCEKDLVVNPETQQRFIDTIEEVSGKEVVVRKIASGHCPNWSRPEELVKLVVEGTEM